MFFFMFFFLYSLRVVRNLLKSEAKFRFKTIDARDNTSSVLEMAMAQIRIQSSKSSCNFDKYQQHTRRLVNGDSPLMTYSLVAGGNKNGYRQSEKLRSVKGSVFVDEQISSCNSSIAGFKNKTKFIEAENDDGKNENIL